MFLKQKTSLQLIKSETWKHVTNKPGLVEGDILDYSYTVDCVNTRRHS